jgi:DNA-binding HxlR family transcriptional regulator
MAQTRCPPTPAAVDGRPARGDTRAGKRSPCPIAIALDILGDKWTLIVLRDLFMGKRPYGAFLESPEKIPTNILAERLKRLVAEGLVERRPYQSRPVRYEYSLTDKGMRLLPVLQELCRWSNRFYPESWKPPARFMKPRIHN